MTESTEGQEPIVIHVKMTSGYEAPAVASEDSAMAKGMCLCGSDTGSGTGGGCICGSATGSGSDKRAR